MSKPRESVADQKARWERSAKRKGHLLGKWEWSRGCMAWYAKCQHCGGEAGVHPERELPKRLTPGRCCATAPFAYANRVKGTTP